LYFDVKLINVPPQYTAVANTHHPLLSRCFSIFPCLACEGGYYLSSVYASLHLIQSLEAQQPPPPGCLTQGAQDELTEWGRRRGREAQIHRENQKIQVGTAVTSSSSSSLLLMAAAQEVLERWSGNWKVVKVSPEQDP